MSIIIAIDGTFASGKGTLAKKLAAHYGFAHLDTGKLYRALAAKALAKNISLDKADAIAALAKNLVAKDLHDKQLKSGKVGANASKIAIYPQVRQALFGFQRDFAKNSGKGAVLDGRDIGTVICPDATVKLYIDAQPKERAQRRHKELLSYGEEVSLAQISAQLAKRDSRDMNREQAPLRAAENAHLLDTTNLSIDAAFETAKKLIDAVLSP